MNNLLNLYNKYSIFIILILGLFIVFLLKCKSEYTVKDKIINEPLTSVVLPVPKKKAAKIKSLPPNKNTVKIDSAIIITDSILEYSGTHPITVNDKPGSIPYTIKSTGTVTDFKLGLNYSKQVIIRDTRLKTYIYGTYDTNKTFGMGLGITTPKYLATYNYNITTKQHNIGIGVTLFSIR